jgi:ribosomal protein uS17
MVQGRWIGIPNTKDRHRWYLHRYVEFYNYGGICDRETARSLTKEVAEWRGLFWRALRRRKPAAATKIHTDSLRTDKKCPFTGLVSIRGRILTGTVVSTKMHRTLIIRREYLHFIPKYARYEKRHKNLAAHVSPAFRVEEGDQVTVGQCRPLSKTVCTWTRFKTMRRSRCWNEMLTKLAQVRFNVLRVLPRTGKAVKQFNKF